jgi:hypothetical protein
MNKLEFRIPIAPIAIGGKKLEFRIPIVIGKNSEIRKIIYTTNTNENLIRNNV